MKKIPCLLCSMCLFAGFIPATSVLVAAEQPDPVTRKVNSLAYFSLRNKTGSDKPDLFYGEERGELQHGYCETLWRRVPLLQSIKSGVSFYVPDGQAQVTGITVLDADTFHRNISDRLQGTRPLLYLHGYNVGFDKACLRARLLQENLQLHEQLILFSWPSDGALTNYPHDEADIAWSVYFIASVLQEMSQRHGPQGFDVVAHSLGNRGAVLALVELASRFAEQGKDIQPINNLVLIAADIDSEVAAQRMPRLARLAHRITMYVSNKDRPLAASRALHGYPRLGEAGEHLQRIRNAEIIDVSEVPSERVSGHLYHLANRYVLGDLLQLIQGNLGAAQRDGLSRDPDFANLYRVLEHPE